MCRNVSVSGFFFLLFIVMMKDDKHKREIQLIVGDEQLKLDTTQGMQRIRHQKKKRPCSIQQVAFDWRDVRFDANQTKSTLSLHILNVFQLVHFNRWKIIGKSVTFMSHKHVECWSVSVCGVSFRIYSRHNWLHVKFVARNFNTIITKMCGVNCVANVVSMAKSAQFSLSFGQCN